MTLRETGRMSDIRRRTDRLSYANVVATIALFISLGGASYAAIALPPHSVGARELRAGAVTHSALAFPLGVDGVTDPAVQDLYKGPCNAPPPPGRPVRVVFCPLIRTRPDHCPVVFVPTTSAGLPRPRREMHLLLRSAGRLVASAIAGLRNDGPPNTTAHVSVSLFVDGCDAASSETALDGGRAVQAPIQLFGKAAPGWHTIGVQLNASYSSYEPGDVFVSPVSLIATVLPPA
jgi:hypothetical protein